MFRTCYSRGSFGSSLSVNNGKDFVTTFSCNYLTAYQSQQPITLVSSSSYDYASARTRTARCITCEQLRNAVQNAQTFKQQHIADIDVELQRQHSVFCQFTTTYGMFLQHRTFSQKSRNTDAKARMTTQLLQFSC